MKDNLYYGINSKNIMYNYIDVGNMNKQEAIDFLDFCLTKKASERAFNPISTDLLLYFEFLYKDDKEIQDRIQILKEQVFNQILIKKKLYTSISHTNEQYDNAREYLFGKNEITIYNSLLRQLLRECRDNEELLL